MSEYVTIGLAVAGWLATGWIAYRWGLRSQRNAELLKAKHAALCEIDRDRRTLEFTDNIRAWLWESQRKLRPLLFAVSSQVLSDRTRIYIERECAKYHDLDIDEWPTARPSEQEMIRMRGLLDELRKTIKRA